MFRKTGKVDWGSGINLEEMSSVITRSWPEWLLQCSLGEVALPWTHPTPPGKVLSAEGRVSPSSLQHKWGGWDAEGKVSGQISLENAGLTGFLMQDFSEPLINVHYRYCM